MSTKKNQNPVGADAPTTGKSVVTSFRYYQDLCFVTLKNGVSGIGGPASVMTFGTMIALKGSGIEVHYQFVGMRGEYRQYRLEWCL